MRYAVTHKTTLRYAAPVRLAQFAVRLRPVDWPGQVVSNYSLVVDPQPSTISQGRGGYLVNEARFALHQPISELRIESSFQVEREEGLLFAASGTGPALTALREKAMQRPDLSALAPASYIFASPIAAPEAEIAGWARGLLNEAMPVMEAGRALMEAIHREFRFDGTATATDTAPIDAFRARHGVCQDFTHVMIIAARAHGIPAAYASGYLRTLPPPGQARLVGADAMHAWVNLWCGDELGWVGFDPTNNKLADTDHILIAMGRDYSDVAPLDGTFRGSSQQKMLFSVDVAPLD